MLQPIPPSERPWKYVGMDLICDMPASTYGWLQTHIGNCVLPDQISFRSTIDI